jgi:hypothetical protein
MSCFAKPARQRPLLGILAHQITRKREMNESGEPMP